MHIENERHRAIRAMRDEGRILKEILDAGYTAQEIVQALGIQRLAKELGLDFLEHMEVPYDCRESG